LKWLCFLWLFQKRKALWEQIDSLQNPLIASNIHPASLVCKRWIVQFLNESQKKLPDIPSIREEDGTIRQNLSTG